MRSATHVLCCTFAALQITGTLRAATSEVGLSSLANPAAQLGQSDLAATLTPYTAADGKIVATAFDAGQACDGCTNCGSGCCDCGSGLADGCCGKDGCCGDACCGDGCCGAGVGGLLGGCPAAPLWTASVGGVVLSRSQPVPSIIGDPIAAVAGIRASDFSIGTTVGVDLLVSRRMTAAGSLEARYLGALEWDPRGEFNALGNWNLGGNNLVGITAIGGGYNSTLHSSELNWRHQQNERFSWLAGFRWIELEDTVDFFVTTGLGSTSLAWNTNNHLYGGQLGADYLFWQSAVRPLSAKGAIKSGVFGNDADNDFSQFVGPVQVLSGGGVGSEVAFVTELALTVSYQLSEQWSVRGGGQFLYIDGVALGSDQVAASLVQATPNVLDAEGYVYYMGGLISLDYVW